MTSDSPMIEQSELVVGGEKHDKTSLEKSKKEVGKEALNVIIVGGGLIGNNLAAKLANEGFRPTIVTKTNSEQDLGTRSSAPIIEKEVARKLGIEMQIDNAAEAISTEKSRQGLVGKIIHFGSRGYLKRHPHAAIDIEKAVSDTHKVNLEDSRIKVIPATFSDVLVQGNKVVGIKVKDDHGEEILPANLVIDATGRVAAVARKLEGSMPGSITETEMESVPNQIVGGYVSFNREGLEGGFPNIDKTMYAGVIGDKVFAIMSPAVRIEESPATHLLLIEGDPEVVKNAYEEITSKSDSNLDANSLRLEVLRKLALGTSWEKLVGNVKSMDRTVYFQHTKDKRRSVSPNVKGLALVGDAAVYKNPILGRGLPHGARSIERLVDKLKNVRNEEDLEVSTDYYNLEQAKKDAMHLENSKKFYRGFRMMRRHN